MKVTVLTSAQDSKYNTKSWPEQEKEVPIFSRDLPEKLWGEELHLLSWLGILHTSSASYINWKKAGAQQGVFTLWDHEKIISSCAGCKHPPPSLLEFQLWRVPKKKKKRQQNKWGTAAVWLNHPQWAWSPLSTLLWIFSELVELFSHYMEDKSKLYLLLLWHFHQKHGCSGNCFINPVY